jgi:hypothetical protein
MRIILSHVSKFILVLKKKNPWIPLSYTRVHSLLPICIKYIMKDAEINVLKLNISTLLAHDAGIFLYVWATPSVIVHRVDKKVWRSGRVADCNPVGRRFAPRMLLLKLSCSVVLVRHLWKMSEKFDIYSKIFFRDVGNFFRHLCELVLRHQMRVSNYFVNSFYIAKLRSLYPAHMNHIKYPRPLASTVLT